MLHGLLFTGHLYAQNCDSRFIELGSQEEVDSFQEKFGDCDLQGFSLRIEGSAITDIQGLNPLRQIDDLYVDSTSVVDLDGLQDLSEVGCRLEINNNALLSNLASLESLERVGCQFEITGNEQLTNLEGLQKLQESANLIVRQNASLTSLSALQGLRQVDWGIQISENSILPSLDGFDGLSQLGYLQIYSNPFLENLSGLQDLEQVDSLIVEGNERLVDLTALLNLQYVFNELTISRNRLLTSIDPLSNISGSLNGRLFITDNESLETLSGLQGITSARYVSLQNNNSLQDISALSQLTSVDEFLIIARNDSLTELGGWENLKTIGSFLSIEQNQNMSVMPSFSGLETIEGSLFLKNNQSLTSISGFPNLKKIMSNAVIQSNASLTTIDGMAELDLVGGQFYLESNPMLIDIIGLAGLEQVDGFFAIRFNDSLVECGAVALLLGWPAGPPDDLVGGDISIKFNGPGCSLDEMLSTSPFNDIEWVPLTGSVCRAQSPSNSSVLQYRETGLLNSGSNIDIDIVCPMTHYNYSEKIQISGGLFSAAVAMTNGSSNEAVLSCFLSEHIGEVEVFRETKSNSVSPEGQVSFQWRNLRPSKSTLSNFTVGCNLPPGFSLTAIKSDKVF